MALRKYVTEQRKKTTKEAAALRPSAPTGVGCTEPDCEGEMAWTEPRQMHPELKKLARAICDKCGWRGWV